CHPALAQNVGSPGSAGSQAQVNIGGSTRSLDWFDGGSGTDTLVGTCRDDTIILDDGSCAPRIQNIEVIDGGWGDDVIDLTSLRYAYGNVMLRGGQGNDTLWSSSGNDVLQGGIGCDSLDGGAGANVLDGGAGADALTDGDGSSFLLGGKQADTLRTGKGADLIAFNRGDGADTVYLGAESTANDVVSLGQGITYASLQLRKSGNDLVLNMGTVKSVSDSITFKNWYSAAANRTVAQLQVVTVGGDYSAASTDVTKNRQVEVFDFTRLVQKFDAARISGTAGSTSSSTAAGHGWAVMNSLLDAHLQGSDTAALGGDLSFQYATAGTLAGIGLAAAQASAAAGTGWQTMASRTQLEQDTTRLV
ncbi:MAG: hypothetical protein H7346_25165, partial [Burkholderiaceae bacterium]|nr:hypothetical protein [Burkholderiaceae bacterium]